MARLSYVDPATISDPQIRGWLDEAVAAGVRGAQQLQGLHPVAMLGEPRNPLVELRLQAVPSSAGGSNNTPRPRAEDCAEVRHLKCSLACVRVAVRQQGENK